MTAVATVAKAKGAKQSMIAQAEKQKDVRACASFSELSQFELWRDAPNENKKASTVRSTQAAAISRREVRRP